MLFTEWLQERESVLLEAVQYIDSDEYARRLKLLGWTCEKSGSHWMCFSPDGIGKVTWTENNWDRRWQQVARDLFRFALGGRGSGGYPDLAFVWTNPFKVPANFDVATQSIIKAENLPGTEMMVSKLMQNPDQLAGRQIKVGTSWKKVELATHSANGMGLEVMFDDESTYTYDMRGKVTVR